MKVLFIFVVLLFAISCDEKSNNNNDDNFNTSNMLDDYTDNYIIPNVNELQTNLNNLKNKLTEIQDNSNTQEIKDLKNIFILTYKSWQKVAFLNFGPSESNSLSSLFNKYPTNIDKIKLNIENSNYNLLSAGNTDAIAFPALDYLLFADLTSTNLSFDNEAYKKYLTDNIDLMLDRTNKTLNEWQTTYKVEFSNNNGKSIGSSLSFIVNSFNAYWEKDLRDGKLGYPIGIRSNGEVLLDKIEAKYSNISLELLKISIESFVEFYTNFENESTLSIYDYLENRRNKYGDGKLHSTILNNFKNIYSRVNNLSGSLESNILNNHDEMLSIYQDIQKQILYLKVDLPAILGVSITYQDNDGD